MAYEILAILLEQKKAQGAAHTVVRKVSDELRTDEVDERVANVTGVGGNVFGRLRSMTVVRTSCPSSILLRNLPEASTQAGA